MPQTLFNKGLWMKISRRKNQIASGAPERVATRTVKTPPRKQASPHDRNGLVATFTIKVKEFARNPAPGRRPSAAELYQRSPVRTR
jgi:hypothetical protein